MRGPRRPPWLVLPAHGSMTISQVYLSVARLATGSRPVNTSSVSSSAGSSKLFSLTAAMTVPLGSLHTMLAFVAPVPASDVKMTSIFDSGMFMKSPASVPAGQRLDDVTLAFRGASLFFHFQGAGEAASPV